MAGEFLSQDEVDALLRGVTGEKEDKATDEIPEDGIRPYNLAKQERIVRGRMPSLEIIHDRFGRLLRTGLFNFMRRNPEVSVGPVKLVKYSEFLRNIVVPTNLNIVSLKPLRGNALFVFEPRLVFSVIDNLFGGDGRYHTRVEGRDFTLTEQRIIQRMLGVVLDEYAKAWAAVHPMQFEYQRAEMHTQFANIATPSEIVVCATFSIEFGSSGGDLHICFPYASVEPIRDALYSPVQGDQMEPDKRWLRMLSKQIQLADVEMVVNLTETDLLLRDLLTMKVGDVIPVDIAPTIPAYVDGVPIFDCKVGVSNGQYAVRIGKVLATLQADNTIGDDHGN
ncbi:flagellar motor switch protein FliM [Pigmentiphaga litoralis]|uniref:Flagellar motor switch protein FliM n=1 Tax=Pigmentiphaga litoralis TaxID=516702 RepID=A0A7Y9IZ68_9BURK|nr:flagellar motor switch protein FliM [Pigmentiphaga litoralis]NYE26856.1 flagellar motor switch protein FliM [Pigmentiphaga litoralis]NYE85734.1 flagellar motor switch protein FliM [Pigmentiphaga litoralis]